MSWPLGHICSQCIAQQSVYLVQYVMFRHYCKFIHLENSNQGHRFSHACWKRPVSLFGHIFFSVSADGRFFVILSASFIIHFLTKTSQDRTYGVLRPQTSLLYWIWSGQKFRSLDPAVVMQTAQKSILYYRQCAIGDFSSQIGMFIFRIHYAKLCIIIINTIVCD